MNSTVTLTSIQAAESEGFADEVSPLIQRHVAASAAELKADVLLVHSETVVHVNAHVQAVNTQMQAVNTQMQAVNTQMQAVKDELKSDMHEINQNIQEISERSRRMEAQLQDLIARNGSS